MRLPPGPRLPRFVQTYLVWITPVPFFRRCAQRFGSTFTLRPFPTKAAVYVSRPEDVKAIFAAPPDVLEAGKANAVLGPVLGRRSVLLADGDEHAERRKLMMPFFHGKSVQRYESVVAEIVDAEIATWPRDVPFGLHERMQAVTLEVILRAVLGLERDDRLDAMRAALRRIVELEPLVLLMWVFPALERVGIWRRQKRWQREAERILDDEIAARRRTPDLERRTDVLSQLIIARHDDGSAMDDLELRDQLLTMLLAGHETTATALAWAFERLTRSPAVMARTCQAAETHDTEYLDAVIEETLRVRPVIGAVSRVVAKPFELAGFTIPPGVTVLASMLLAHEGPSFDEPGAFRPERFLAEPKPNAFTDFPFGGGRRRCLGASFASLEMRTVLRRVLTTVTVAAVSSEPEEPLATHITLIPLDGARVRVADPQKKRVDDTERHAALRTPEREAAAPT